MPGQLSRRVLLVTLALVAAALGAAPASARVALDRVERATGSETLDIVFSLAGRREAALREFVRAVSDPASPRYRRYLSIEQVADRFGAPRRHSRAVVAYLAERGLRGEVDPSGTFVAVRMTTGDAQELFRTTLVRVPGAANGRVAIQPVGRPRVPDALRNAVEVVVGLDTRPVVTTAAASGTPAAAVDAPATGPGASGLPRSGTPAGCEAGQNSRNGVGVPGFTPNQWLTAYGLDRLHARGVTGTGQRIALIEIDGYLESDLQAAGQCFGYTPPPLRIVLAGIDQPLTPGAEATLDLQILSAAAPDLESIDVYQGNASLAGLVLTLARPFEEPPGRRPDVVSASLGVCEARYSGGMTFLRATENLFAAIAATGVSFVASAGDTGSSACSLAGNSSALATLSVSYAASSAYVTGVGGTNLDLNDANGIVDQIVWNDNPLENIEGRTIFGGAGSGGQSVVINRPWWQRGPHISGPTRLVPDVSFLADLAPGYSIYCSVPESICQPGGFVSVGGTSAAAPLLAAGVALANEQAVQVGQPRLGFLNPLLYALGNEAGTVFYDVTTGTNDVGPFLATEAGGGEPLGCCDAHVGYDLASGWGSLDIPTFSSAARAAYAERPS